MQIFQHKIVVAVVIFIALQLSACDQWQSNYVKIEPAHLEHAEGSELTTLTLTEKAVERTGILTAPVSEEVIADEYGKENTRLIVPYAAVLYDAHGHTWVFNNPKPLVYVRHEIKVDFIEGDKAVLHEGPPAGTKVVTQGAAELYGTEFQVGH